MSRNLLDRKSEYPEFTKLTDLIDKTIDFGAQIYSWEVETNLSRESIVCQVFFKNMLEIGDGISILIQKSSVDNANIILRSLIENIFYLEYLLEDDYRNRALGYLVSTFHIEENLSDKLDANTEDGRNFRNKVTKDKTYQGVPFIEPRIQSINYGTGFDRLLNHPDFIEVEKEYQMTAAAMKKQLPPWYSLFGGPRSLEQLANKLKLNARYEILYRILSERVHSTNVIKHSLADFEHGPGLGPMRNPENAGMIASLTLICLEMVYSNFVEKRIPAKVAEYEEWHREFSKEYDLFHK